MIEIKKHNAGTLCSSCKMRPAQYSIRGEWDGPSRPCQGSMLKLILDNEVIRLVLALQSATRECAEPAARHAPKANPRKLPARPPSE